MVGSDEPVISKGIIAATKVGTELLELEAGGNLDAFSGRRWVIDNPNIQYTELYEKELEGVVVRVERRGRNGKFMMQYDKTEWDNLIAIASERKAENPYEDNGPQMNELEMYGKYNETVASESGGEAVGRKSQGRRRRPKNDIQENEVQESDGQTEIEC